MLKIRYPRIIIEEAAIDAWKRAIKPAPMR
jgi:hypothetical protein